MSKFLDRVALNQQPAFFVNWLTYAHNRAAGKIGLGDYLAQCYGGSCVETLLEGSNDQTYQINTVKITSFDHQSVARNREVITGKIRAGEIEHWYLSDLLVMATVDGHLPPGHYVITQSW